MKTQYVAFLDGAYEAGRKYNQDMLAHDLERFGYVPTYVGPVISSDLLNFGAYAPSGLYLSTVERYPNGAANVFVKDAAGKVRGFVRVRPE